MRIVCKFGGSSLASSENFTRVKDILAMDSRRSIVVPSAPGKRHSKEAKITDLLYACHELASKNLDFDTPFNELSQRYQEIEQELNLSCNIAGELSIIKSKIKQGETADYVASRGEFLNGKLMAAYLGAEFIDPEQYVIFDNFGDIDPVTYDKLGESMADENVLYVMPGFYGSYNGHIKTFSRGGSDISGAIAARAVNAVLYENWTDVSGLLMADPRIVENAKTMDCVTYREIRELSYMGANVFHDEAISPVREMGIPIQIKNTMKPGDSGTRIVSKPEVSKKVVAGIAGKKDAVLFYVEKSMMNKQRGFGRKVLGIFESHDISYEHSPTGIDSMSIIVLKEELGEKAEAVCLDIKRIMQPDKVLVYDDLSLIATVGEGMQHAIGTAARLFSALSTAGINVRIIDQGSSELNIIVGVNKQDYEKAIKTLYSSFVAEANS